MAQDTVAVSFLCRLVGDNPQGIITGVSQLGDWEACTTPQVCLCPLYTQVGVYGWAGCAHQLVGKVWGCKQGCLGVGSWQAFVQQTRPLLHHFLSCSICT